MSPKVKWDDKPYSFVEVIWYDACSASGWEPVADQQVQKHICYSRGWLVKDDEHAVILAACIGTLDGIVDDGNMWQTIPKSMIKSLTYMLVSPYCA